MFKIVLIGDNEVGKTSIRYKYFGKKLRRTYIMTLGADFAMKKLGKYIFQIWDLAGQDAFLAIRKSYYNGINGAILIFDITNKKTFNNLNKWIDEMHRWGGKMVPTVIVGNKIDLREQGLDTIDQKTIDSYLEELRYKYNLKFVFFETSAISGKNITEVFNELLDEIKNNKKIS